MARELVKYDKTEDMLWFNNMLQHFAKSMIEGYRGDGINTAVTSIYPFTNENLEDTYKVLNPEGKNVLTVGSSGDQVVLCLALGANKITLIDANPMSLAYLELKLAGIKHLTQKEYIDMFYGPDGFEPDRHEFLSHELYAKISHSLSTHVREFWDEIYMNLDPSESFRNGFDSLFQPVANEIRAVRRNAFFHNAGLFNQAKANLNDCEIDFKCAEFNNFASTFDDKTKFDIIQLSNICDYVRRETLFIQTFALSHLLNRGGKIEMAYHFSSNVRSEWNNFMEDFASFCNDMNLLRVNHLVASHPSRRDPSFEYNGVERKRLSCNYCGNYYVHPIISCVSKEYLDSRVRHLGNYVTQEIANALIKPYRTPDDELGVH